jgi:hypothetical protein
LAAEAIPAALDSCPVEENLPKKILPPALLGPRKTVSFYDGGAASSVEIALRFRRLRAKARLQALSFFALG